MGRNCSECGDWCSRGSFTSNQWSKGNGTSRCKDCVSLYQCQECHRKFHNSNELKMHMQTHRPRNIACPVCGEGQFRSGANAVQHVESGYCSCCRGVENARQQVYEFARKQRGMKPYLNGRPLLTYGGCDDEVPDYPYKCQECSRNFRQLSQLLQHQDNKHGRKMRMIGK